MQACTSLENDIVTKFMYFRTYSKTIAFHPMKRKQNKKSWVYKDGIFNITPQNCRISARLKKPFSPERWCLNKGFIIGDTIFKILLVKNIKILKQKQSKIIVTKMFVSWPVPRGKGSNAAPQGDGIWDHSSMEELNQ